MDFVHVVRPPREPPPEGGWRLSAEQKDSWGDLTFGKNDEESRERLRELILYIAGISRNDPDFGATKLNKLLFYADFISFAENGRPLTHAQYRKKPHGPVPTSIDSLIVEMEANRDAAVVREGLAPYTHQRVFPLREARIDEYFTPSEIALVDEVVRTLHGLTATQVSEMPHEFAWQIAEDNDLIPYDAVYLYDRELSDQEVARAHELAAKFEWNV